MRLTILDNRDSFVWNLVQLVAGLGVEVDLLEAHSTRLAELLAHPPDALLIGPGPGHPRAAKLSIELFGALPNLPMLGICLGHQALALAHGATIGGTPELAHGRPVAVHHDATGLFRGLPRPAIAGRYHSLTVLEESLPRELEVTGRSPAGELLALAHRTRPHFGLQFHPESILADCGPRLLGNFLELVPR